MRIDRYNGNTLRRYHVWGGSIAIVRCDPGPRWTGVIPGHLPNIAALDVAPISLAAQLKGFRAWEREKEPPTTFIYERWRHGGWYVCNVRYRSGAVGCVSRNYEDCKWRIVCDPRPFDQRPTFKNRDDAARAEWFLAHGKEEGN